MARTFTQLKITVEVDSDYDNEEALIDDIKTAIDENEGITLAIAGHSYEVAIVGLEE